MDYDDGKDVFNLVHAIMEAAEELHCNPVVLALMLTLSDEEADILTSKLRTLLKHARSQEPQARTLRAGTGKR